MNTMYCKKNNGKWKLQTRLSQSNEFAFKNLFKTETEMPKNFPFCLRKNFGQKCE
jgi:hypothetical protein